MSTAVAAGGTIIVDDDLRAQAENVVTEAHDRRMVGVTIRLEDGSTLEAEQSLAEFIARVVNGVSRGPITTRALPDEVTTTTAAEMLGVSRPTVIKWISAGDLVAHMVGSHRRLRTVDVIRFRDTLRARREQAFAELQAFDERFE